MADIEVADTPIVSFKKRGGKAKVNARKREATPPPEASDSDSGFTSSEDESGRKIKRRKKNVTVVASSTNTAPNRAAGLPIPQVPSTKSLTTKDDATKTETWYDEDNTSKTSKSAPNTADTAPDGNYRGLSSYTSFLTPNPNRDPPKSAQIGPQKGSSNVRTITVTDFAPDVCKDYKQTGFCGFGDSCKFLHAREAYAQGWQLDREWEINTKSGKKVQGGKSVASASAKLNGTSGADASAVVDDDALLESIPFACIICKESYKNPVVTKCDHYFCEACALKRYRKNPSCAACSQGTGGVFNVAKKLNKLLERKREREKEKELAEAERD